MPLTRDEERVVPVRRRESVRRWPGRGLIAGLSAFGLSVAALNASLLSDASAGARDVPPPAVAPNSRIQAMISDAWSDATKTWEVILGEQVYQSDVPQINFVPAVRASHCYGLYIGTGPVYCSGNTTVFVSVASMQDLDKRFPGIGDAGLAFLVAHELGHHVQKVTGRFRVVNALMRSAPQLQRELALRFELEADCLAGVWASKSPRFAATEAARAAMMSALEAIGDDRILGANGGKVDPAAYTHGSSAQRVKWFKHGLDNGNVSACDVLEVAAY